MFSTRMEQRNGVTDPASELAETNLERLKNPLSESDGVVIGAGAGLSAF